MIPRAALAAAVLCCASIARADLQPVVPPEQRGTLEAERSGTHDAANIRTVFWNYGMVGDYPADPLGVDLSVFHSAEAPKGSGMNYTDGITPFVLAKVQDRSGLDKWIMETGYRERQAISPYGNRVERFEPRPGFFEADPTLNKGRSPAVSNDPRTWPASWPDKVLDPDDPGWKGSWNGYFGKRAAADQESYTVMDDDYYNSFDYYPDSRDSTRRGLGLRVEVRGFQWANPQAGNVIFWHYDITNEGTTDYNDNIIFGLYMDSGVGGSALSCDGIAESDDDNAFFDNSRLNLVYTWDRGGHGVDLAGSCSKTGYLGYAYLETPGKPLDGVDNDNDGIVDEVRDGGPGERLEGAAAIEAYVDAHYNRTAFEVAYGPVADRPAYRAGVWWTGDEDMDWVADLHDTGADGVPDTHDTGEGDGVPTDGETNFDRTDLHESDQIGLTGFKLNRIRCGTPTPPDCQTDGILFYTESSNWPERLYEQFTDPDPAKRFDPMLASNYNIGFLFASGPFTLGAGKRERFSLALAYGADLEELRSTITTVQQIYNANYQFAVPPELPTVTAEPGDGYVRLSWNDIAERSVDPVTYKYDFEGYRIYRSTDPEFRDPKVISTGRGSPGFGNGQPIAQFDLVDGWRGYSRKTVEGVAYWLGAETGITHTWVDTTVTNGQQYYYAVCAYDYGYDLGAALDSLSFYPSENAITVSRTPRGGIILPPNVVAARPNPRVAGFARSRADTLAHVSGRGTGTVDMEVVNSALVPDGHLFSLTFTTPSPDSLRATMYALRDSTDHTTAFSTGADLEAAGTGPIGFGMLPRISTPAEVSPDEARSGWQPGGATNTLLESIYQPTLPNNQVRPGYPDDITVTFYDTVVDTGIILFPITRLTPAKFHIVAHSAGGDVPLKFRFRDLDASGTLDSTSEYIDVITYTTAAPATPITTWRLQLDPSGHTARAGLIAPKAGDVYDLYLTRPFSADDEFVFRTSGEHVDAAVGGALTETPYVVPNPYLGSASFEPARFAISGRGERRIEFRAIPLNASVAIYTVHGELVRRLVQDGSSAGVVAWDLRTKDNLDVAPGMYVYHVAALDGGEYTGKLAVIK